MKKSLCLVSLIISFAVSGNQAFSVDESTFKEQIDANMKIVTESNERIKADKDDVDSLYARGTAHFHLGQIYIILYSPGYSKKQNQAIKDEFEAAEADFTSVIDKKPDLLQAYIMRGMTYGQMGLSAAAIADFSHVIEVDPKNSLAYYARGREYWASKEYEKAKEDYNTAVELDPQWKDSFYR